MRSGFIEALSRLGIGVDALDETLNAAPFGVLINHVEDGCIYASETVLRIFEMGWEELRGFGWMAAVIPEDMEALRGTFERYQRDKQPIEVRYRIRTGDGKTHPIAAFANPILDATGKQLGSVIVGRRAPEHALAERSVQTQKLEAIGRLAGRVSHDFNNILTPILCSASMLATESLSDRGQEQVATIQQGVEHAAALTAQLLGLSRQGGHGPRASVIDHEVRALSSMLEQLVGERISLTLELRAADARVGLPPHEVGQVLLNLCVNGRDAVEGVGSIDIRTRSDGALVDLTVSDSGVGITQDVQLRMFEPFFTTKSPEGGTGLGLASARELVRRAGGDITVRSELGHGTQMRVTLPVLCGTKAQAPSPQPHPGTLASQRILLVDDNDALRQTVAYVLAMRGHEVTTSATVSRATTLLHEQPFDVLITDVLLPDGNGDELARGAPPETRIVYMSGYTGTDFEPRHAVEGGAAFLQKPFRPEEVLAALSSLLPTRSSGAS